MFSGVLIETDAFSAQNLKPQSLQRTSAEGAEGRLL